MGFPDVFPYRGKVCSPDTTDRALQRGLGSVFTFFFFPQSCCRQEAAIQMQVLRAMQAGLLLSTASALCGGAGTHGWTDGRTDRQTLSTHPWGWHQLGFATQSSPHVVLPWKWQKMGE